MHQSVSLIDQGHHVGSCVGKSPGKVVCGWFSIIGLPGALALGVGGDKASTRCAGASEALGCLVELGRCGPGLIGLEEGARGYGPGATFKLAESADAVVEELKGLMELVGGNLVEPVIAKVEGVLHVAQWVHEQDAQLVKYLDGPEDQWFVGAVALLEVCVHGRE